MVKTWEWARMCLAGMYLLAGANLGSGLEGACDPSCVREESEQDCEVNLSLCIWHRVG